MKYSGIAKKDIIKAIWNPDEQIAIILNREDEPDIFEFMQEWRKKASEIAKKVKP